MPEISLATLSMILGALALGSGVWGMMAESRR